MSKALVSLATIHVALVAGSAGNARMGEPSVAPVVREVPAGTLFNALDADQEKELTDMGAARFATDQEKEGREPLDLTDEAEAAQAINARRSLASPTDVTAAKGTTTDTDDAVARARQTYQELFGEAPHSNMKLAGLTAKIAEREAEIAAKKTGGTSDLV